MWAASLFGPSCSWGVVIPHRRVTWPVMGAGGSSPLPLWPPLHPAGTGPRSSYRGVPVPGPKPLWEPEPGLSEPGACSARRRLQGAISAGSPALGQSSSRSQSPAAPSSPSSVHALLGAGSKTQTPRVSQPWAKTVPGVRTQPLRAPCTLH